MTKNHFLKFKFLCSFVFCFLWFSVPVMAGAAILYLEPSQRQYQPGDTFIVEARIDTEEECINTVKANLNFPQDILKAVDFSQGKSILTLWVNPPNINQESGIISFTGGIPGGYCGKIPGDPGVSNLLGRVVFQVRETGAKLEHETDAKVEFLDSSEVLLNDGFGTPAKLNTQGVVFTILPQKEEPTREEWQKELIADTIPPEPFEIEIQKDPQIFEGKYFIIFLTTDKQTGLDYFEVKEGKKDFKKASSPYLLEDQALGKKIIVRAYDKAGNWQEAEIKPPYKITWKDGLYLILILVGMGAIWWIIKRQKIEARK